MIHTLLAKEWPLRQGLRRKAVREGPRQALARIRRAPCTPEWAEAEECGIPAAKKLVALVQGTEGRRRPPVIWHPGLEHGRALHGLLLRLAHGLPDQRPARLHRRQGRPARGRRPRPRTWASQGLKGPGRLPVPGRGREARRRRGLETETHRRGPRPHATRPTRPSKTTTRTPSRAYYRATATTRCTAMPDQNALHEKDLGQAGPARVHHLQLVRHRLARRRGAAA